MAIPETGGAAGSGVLASAAAGAGSFFAAHGGEPEAIFARAGLDPAALDTPTRIVSLKSVCALFEAAADETGLDNIGLAFGRHFEPADLGLLGHVALSSPSLGAALDNVMTLFAYHQQGTAVALSRERGLLRLSYRIYDGAIVRRRQNAEAMLGLLANLFRACHGRGWAPEEVHFEHAEPLEPREHPRAFGAPVFFGQRLNALLVRPADLEREMPGADPRLLGLMRHCLMAMGIEPARRQSVTAQVKGHILAELSETNPTLEKAAEALGVPAWTLQRRLAEAGTTFSELVEETRQELAVSYLREPHLPLTEIAFLLGYSELSAFSRAFQRWTGSSPRAYRKVLVRPAARSSQRRGPAPAPGYALAEVPG